MTYKTKGVCAREIEFEVQIRFRKRKTTHLQILLFMPKSMGNNN